LADRGKRVGACQEGVTVLEDGLGEAQIIAMAIAELAVQRQPACSLGARRELAEQDRLTGAAQAGERPVGVQWGIRF
jgi:hypothetical protein